MLKITRRRHGARDATIPLSMLPRLEYFDDQLDEDETHLLHDEMEGLGWDDDANLDTRLMPAKHGAKAPLVPSHDRLQVPSPYPQAPKQYASGVRHKVMPPPPPPRSEPPPLPSLFAEMYSSVESTGSDVHHPPVHHMDGAPRLPSTTALAARRAPWKIQVTPPEFEPFAMPMFQPPGTHLSHESSVAPAAARARKAVAEKALPEKKSHKTSAIIGGLFGIVCGVLVVSIANGTLTQKDARTGLAHAMRIVDAVLAHH